MEIKVEKKVLLWSAAILLLVIVVVIIIRKKMSDFKRPVNGIVTSGYGYRTHPKTGEHHLHNGVDFGAPVGTPILAPASGTVKSIYSNAAGGNQLIIKHDNGFTTGYAHIHEYHVKVGDKVKSGDKIATVGATGNVTGPHLHFTMRDKNNKIIDPMKHLV